jgi:monoamine oxidase
METSDVLIIGAGAAGLMAAYKLSQKGKKIIVLEARGRTGGRIHTLSDQDFFKQAELGAEFIHGDLPVTLNLLKEAGIAYEHAGGEMLQYAGSKFTCNENFIEHWDLLIEKLKDLKADKSIGEFLTHEFSGEKYKSMRSSVTQYVSGYDTADVHKASAFALRREWLSEDDDAQHRVTNGYCSMINYLANSCKKAGGLIYLNSIVKNIDWETGKVKAITADGSQYSANKLILAMPLGVLQAGAKEKCAVAFNPPIPKYLSAINKLGFGAIIKFLLEFDAAFWENEAVQKNIEKNLQNMAFIISDQEIPTWWTQYPRRSSLLTGWLGGQPAEERKSKSTDELLQLALQSLSNIFKLKVDELKTRLVAWNIANWTTDPFTLGSYVYDTIEAPEARKVLIEAIDDTLYFAGEYLYDGPAMGTVEAALTSGAEVSEKIDQ